MLMAIAACLPVLAHASQLVATVEGVPVTTADIELRMRNDPELRFKTTDVEGARDRAFRSLVIEIAAEHTWRSVLQRDSELSSLLDQVRRQKIIELYDVSATQDITLTPDEVAQYVARNPQFFKDRKTWHYHEVVVKARTPEAVAEMRGHAAQIAAMGNVAAGQVGPTFQWAQQALFDTTLGNRWQGSEEIDAPVFSLLQAMQANGKAIHTECVQDRCTFVIFHEAYSDPTDPVAMNSVLESTLLMQKRSGAYDNINRHLLKTVQIEFHDPATAERIAAEWGRQPYLTATSRNRGLWIAVLTLVGLVTAWSVHQFRFGGSLVDDPAFRPRWTANLRDATYARLYGPAMQRLVAGLIAAAVFAEAGWILVATAFFKFTHDFAWVAAGAVVTWIGAAVVWRYSPQLRPLLERRRVVVSFVLVVQGLIVLFSGLLG